MIIDSCNENNARSALLQLRLDRETSDGVGMYLEIGWKLYQRMSYFVFGVIIVFWRWLRTKFSCEVQHRL